MHKRFLYTLLILLLVGCTERARTPNILPEWGRAGRLGVASRSQPAALAVSPDGDRVVVAWVARDEGSDEDYIRLLTLDGQGHVVLEQDLAPFIPYLQRVQLLLGTDGALHLFWSAGRQGERTLGYASLPPIQRLGTVPVAVLEPRQISSPDVSVGWYKVILLPSDEVLALWEGGHGHVFARVLSQADTSAQIAPSDLPQAAYEILSGALHLDAQLDSEGNVQVVWLSRDTAAQLGIYRATLTTRDLTLSPPVSVTTIALPGQVSPSSVDGPTLSLDRAWAYISWTQRYPSQSGSETLKTLAVPLYTDAVPIGPQDFRAVSSFPPGYAPAEGDFAYENLSYAGGGDSNVAVVRHPPVTLAFPRNEVVMAVPMQYATRTRQQFQPTLIYWHDGVFRGYQVLTWTRDVSVMPSIATDANHNIYITWIDIGDRFHYPVYLATTADELQAAWQHLTWEDVGTILIDLTSRVASGVVLLPLIAMWLLLPFVWLFVMLAQGGDTYGARGVRILLVALLVYEASKYVLTRRILTYVPMIAYLPPHLGTLLIYGIPLMTLFISFGLVGFVTLRRMGKDFSVMRTYVYTTLLDVMLSLAVYGIGYWE